MSAADEKLAEATRERELAQGLLNSLDKEAKAYSACVAALSEIRSATGSYPVREWQSGRRAVERVLNSLKERFEIGPEHDQADGLDFAPPPLDPKDIVISKLVEALRNQ